MTYRSCFSYVDCTDFRQKSLQTYIYLPVLFMNMLYTIEARDLFPVVHITEHRSIVHVHYLLATSLW